MRERKSRGGQRAGDQGRIVKTSKNQKLEIGWDGRELRVTSYELQMGNSGNAGTSKRRNVETQKGRNRMRGRHGRGHRVDNPTYGLLQFDRVTNHEKRGSTTTRRAKVNRIGASDDAGTVCGRLGEPGL